MVENAIVLPIKKKDVRGEWRFVPADVELLPAMAGDMIALASRRADYIVALAKSKTLDDFGEEEAADTIAKPYILEGE